jgi:hypothetical protein
MFVPAMESSPGDQGAISCGGVRAALSDSEAMPRKPSMGRVRVRPNPIGKADDRGNRDGPAAAPRLPIPDAARRRHPLTGAPP